jgi:hypothetical protein
MCKWFQLFFFRLKTKPLHLQKQTSRRAAPWCLNPESGVARFEFQPVVNRLSQWCGLQGGISLHDFRLTPDSWSSPQSFCSPPPRGNNSGVLRCPACRFLLRHPDHPIGLMRGPFPVGTEEIGLWSRSFWLVTDISSLPTLV